MAIPYPPRGSLYGSSQAGLGVYEALGEDYYKASALLTSSTGECDSV